MFTTQHRLSGGGTATPGIILPKGTALIGLSACGTTPITADVSVTLEIAGRATTLKVTIPKGSKGKYRSFALADYKDARDWVSGEDHEIRFKTDVDLPPSAEFQVVAFWRSNRLPVF